MDGNQWRDCANNYLMLNSENGGVGAGRRSKTTDMSMARNISLFNKYLFEKAHQNMSSARSSELRTKPRCGALLPYQTHEFRMPSLLERDLIVGIKPGRRAPKSTFQPRVPKAQLTIFYAGTVNVYDNVPVDKAEAIMLLAGGTASSSKPAKSRVAVAAGASTASRVISEKRTDIDVPMARKQSLHRFLEKRRDRIVNVAPYFSIKREVDEAKPLNV